MSAKSTRREFLRVSSITSLGLMALPEHAVSLSLKPLGPGGNKKKIIVVGAGLAGLSAAYRLSQAGHEVKIFEAQMQPGGRVRTIRSPFADDFYAEAGAGRFPMSHDLTLHFIKAFGLSITPFYPASGNMTTYVGGGHIFNPYDKERDLNQLQLPLTTDERQLGDHGLFNTYVSPVLEKIGDPAQKDWLNDAREKLDQMNWTQFLRRRGMSDAAIRYFNTGAITLDDGKEVSALWLLRDMLSGGKKFKIKGGNDQLPRAFAKRLENQIHYGCPVKKIEQSEHGVRVFYKNSLGEQTETGDHLILAVPFSVARDIDLTPTLTSKKREAINNLQYASASRVTLQFKKRSWESKGLNGFATSDDPLQVWHPTFDQKGNRGILQSYIRLSLSRQLRTMTENQRIEFVLNKIERIFPGVRSDFEGGLAKCWDEDPWAKGAAAVHAPGQLSAYANVFNDPEGRIYFAGDHLSPWPAWMQGAIYSGISVAEKINAT